MAQTANDILGEILIVVKRISDKIDTSGGAVGGAVGGAAATVSPGVDTATKGIGFGGGLKGMAVDAKQGANLKETGAALKAMGAGVSSLAGGMLKWMLVPGFAKKSFSSFLENITDIAGDDELSAATFRITAEGLLVIGNALPVLAKGVRSFGLMAKLGLVKATTTGITALLGSLVAFGPFIPIIAAVGVALHGLGAALSGLGDLMKSLALVIVGFATGILIMVGAIALASKLFNTGALESMLIIVGAIAVLAGGFALIGVLSPLILLAGSAVASMGIGLVLIGLGLLAFLGSMALLEMMGLADGAAGTIMSMVKPLILLSLLFAGIGILSVPIMLGGKATEFMGKGMIFLAVGLLAMGAVGALLQVMNIDIFNVILSVAKSVGLMALLMAGLGLISGLIYPGIVVMLALSGSLILLSIALFAITAIINELGGEAGLLSATKNIADLVGAVLIGVVKGVSKGLLGEDGESKGFFGKVGTVAVNTAILIGAIFLISGVSIALSLFAMSLRGFAKVGIMQPIVGHKPDGTPIYGDPVNVVDVANSIAVSLGVFFQTLVETFNDPTKVPDAAQMQKITDILLGPSFSVTGVFGIKMAGASRPGLMEALSMFANVIQVFSQVQQLPLYDTKGNVTGFIGPADIASNIVDTLVAFFAAFKANEETLTGLNADGAHTLAKILMGRSATSLGWGFLKLGDDEIGLIDPLMKFAELISMLGGTNDMTYIDDKGVERKMNPGEMVSNILKSLSSFASGITTSLTLLGKVDTASRKSALDNMTELNVQLERLVKQRSGLEKLAPVLEKIATSMGSLGTAMAEIESEKLKDLAELAKSMPRGGIEGAIDSAGDFLGAAASRVLDFGAKVAGLKKVETAPEAGKTPAVPATPDSNVQASQPIDWDTLAMAIGQQVAQAMKNGTFNFVFDTDKSGVLTMGR